MSTATAVSPVLQSRIAAVARRVRFLRAVRGVSLVVVLLGVTGGAALLADHCLELPSLVRLVILGSWAAIGAIALLFGLALPLSRPLDTAAVAAVIEERYSELGERLTSSIELGDHADAGNGSPELIAWLIQDTESRSQNLDFRPAVPGRTAMTIGLAAMFVLGLAIAPAVIWPKEYARLGQRFLRPWHVPPVVPPYALEVVPGDIFAARGRDLRLTARLVPENENVALPATCTLFRLDGDGNETPVRMIADRSDVFSTSVKVNGDFRYYIQAGLASSDVYSVTAVAPVALAPESPTITVTPPQYASATLDVQDLHGLVDLAALKHGTIRFAFKFTRPAVAATLFWTAASDDPLSRDAQRSVPHPLTLNANATEASLEFPANAPGAYRVVLEAEHGIRTELDGGTLTVTPDRPPSFLKVSTKLELRAVLPYDRLPLEMTLADDIGVASAGLEYRVNGGKPVVEPIALKGVNTRDAVGKHLFLLADKVEEGDEVRYRVRCEDNLPKEFGGPHTVYHPADRWLILKVVKQAKPIEEQEILAQRDDVKRRVEAIKADLVKEQRGLNRLSQDTRKTDELSRDQADSLKLLQRENQAVERALRDLGRDSADNASLEPIAARAQEIAEGEMRKSDTALHEGGKQKTAEDRTRKFAGADKQLASAVKKLDELNKANDKLAQDRLDQAKVEMLAERQKSLADKAAELAAKDPVRDPAGKDDLEKVKREQAEVAAELERMTQQSESLRAALDKARAEQARQLAERARDLAEAQRDLARASRETEQQRTTARLGELARRQKDLAEKARELAKDTKAPAEVTRTNPLKPEDAEKAAAALRLGDAEDGARLQDRSAKELDRLAKDFDKAIELARDPKEAARQLARLQEGLQKRLQDEVAKKDSKPLAERIEPLKREQTVIRQAAEKLSVPPQNQDAQQAKKQAVENAARAAEAMAKDPKEAGTKALPQAKEALNRLADHLPDVRQRRQEALRQMAELKRQQEEVGRIADQADRQMAKAEPQAKEQAGRQMQEAAKKQAEIAEALSKMDAPNQEARKEKSEAAANRALQDLMDAKREDVAASQSDVKRQMERLEQALAGKKPADERARDLAKRQQELNRQTAQANADPKTPAATMQDLQRKQQAIAQEAKELPAPEAPQLKAEAAEATQKASNTLPNAAEAQPRMEEAARKLDELARRMEGAKPSSPDDRQQQPSSPKEQAKQLVNQQRQLAKATEQAQQKAAQKPDVAARKALQEEMENIARLQRNLNKQASKLPANQAQKGLEQARAAMNQAEQALTKKDAGQAKQKQNEAASALDRLAQQMPAQANKPQANPAAEARANPPQGLPNKDRADRARRLAQEQREIREAVQRTGQTARADNAPRKNEAAELAKQQAEIARQAGELARNVAMDQGGKSEPAQQAAKAQQATQQASKQMQAGALPQAQQAGEKAAQGLRQLAQEMANTPRGPNADAHAQEPVQQARQLAQRQEEINRKIAPLAKDADAQRGAQQAQQQALQKHTGELAKELGKLAQGMARTPQGAQAAQQAAASSQQAQAAMQQAQTQSRQGNQGEAQQAQQQAAAALDRASQQATQAAGQQTAARPGSPPPGNAPAQQAGQSLQEAQSQISQAQGQLGQGQPKGAQQAMANAAQALQQASRELAQANAQNSQSGGQPKEKPGQPSQVAGEPAAIGSAGAGRPDASLFGADARKYAGKTWGELPGELRTKIVQDMKARYGEDYARMIKLYFEQIAETKRK